MDDRASPDTTAAAESAQLCLNAAQRTPSPTEVVLRYEGRAEEWHFDEAIHKSQLDDQRALSLTFKDRERHASERHASDVQGHEQQIAMLLASAEAEERQCALELAALREELIEAQHQNDDLEEDCEQEVVALDDVIRRERQRRSALEEELENEKRSVLRATQHITEIEDREGQLIRLKRTRMADIRSACRQQCLEIQQSADKEIQKISAAVREEVEATQKLIDNRMKETQRNVTACVKQRQDVTAETEREISNAVDTQVYQSLASVQMLVLEARETSLGQIKEVQARDREHEGLLKERIDDALVSVNCSLQERDQISVLERSHKLQLEAATHILGCSLPMNRYSLADNRRLRSAGALALGAA